MLLCDLVSVYISKYGLEFRAFRAQGSAAALGTVQDFGGFRAGLMALGLWGCLVLGRMQGSAFQFIQDLRC